MKLRYDRADLCPNTGDRADITHYPPHPDKQHVSCSKCSESVVGDSQNGSVRVRFSAHFSVPMLLEYYPRRAEQVVTYYNHYM